MIQTVLDRTAARVHPALTFSYVVTERTATSSPSVIITIKGWDKLPGVQSMDMIHPMGARVPVFPRDRRPHYEITEIVAKLHTVLKAELKKFYKDRKGGFTARFSYPGGVAHMAKAEIGFANYTGVSL